MITSATDITEKLGGAHTLTERIETLAEQVWEDPGLAREFLTSAQPQLGGERPIDLARTELGAREV